MIPIWVYGLNAWFSLTKLDSIYVFILRMSFVGVRRGELLISELHKKYKIK